MAGFVDYLGARFGWSGNPVIVDQVSTGPTSQGPITGAAAIAPSDTVSVTAGRQFLVSCTVAGNLKVTFSDGSTLTFTIPVGLSVFSWAITKVWVTGTIATVTCTNLL